jgi:hypothetical protein
MTGREDIRDALEQVDSDLARLRDRILAGGDVKLLEGEWTVREALCHMAARSDSVTNMRGRIERTGPNAATIRRAAQAIDEVNQGQIEEREGRTVAELLDEIARGHAAAKATAMSLPDDLLAIEVPRRDGGTQTGTEAFLGTSANHDRSHLAQIEAALNAGVTATGA